MIKSAVRLQRTRGVAGTAFSDVLADSGAPRGSVYHHFPQGRGQLAEAATEHGAEWIAEQLEEMLAGGDPLAALEAFVDLWSGVVLEEAYQAGCAVAAGALDPDHDSGARRAAAAGFRRWETLLADAFAPHVGADQAQALAVTCIAAIEGALILVRAEASLRPLELVAEQLSRVLFQSIAAQK
ncbi:TetR/AcrR family transcriptional regulator [Conexibacter sp. CPCC 206217]|uniref:TetR/AcrR family transcriptional regulator n=1 Tax=Conexibacter sp. CPCC 206217 TaxID=3064574 RepID=UPI0027241001|nr:TetR/AcrR family transcriptional regulator [Conexibacter sp. CPCC 206217]MDO8208867.1 TetR/AcrR family transcriptional regulator [Conexibacter sp. CPCC 206217]